MLVFTLSMPNVGSWNGEWTGSENLYVKTRRAPPATIARILKEKSETDFSYNFGDGWWASVRVKSTSAAEANKIMRHSAGFCGYDWMIDEIMQYGRILTREERNDASIRTS